MANLNIVPLMGNLTRDPELRYTPKGTAVADISLAINRKWRTDAGQTQEETTFVDITLWGHSAENANKYLTKGRGCYVEGRLQMDTWDDKETGKKRTKMKIVGTEIQFLPGGDRNGSRPPDQPTHRESHTSSAPPSSQTQTQSDYAEEDDIPF